MAANDKDVVEEEIHVFLLQGRGAESLPVAGSQRPCAVAIARREFGGGATVVSDAEIVIARRRHRFPLCTEMKIRLHIAVGRELSVSIAAKLVGEQIVARQIASAGQFERVSLCPQRQRRRGIEGANGVLHVAVVAHIESCGDIIVAFVVLVEAIPHLTTPTVVSVPLGFDAAGEIAVTIPLAGIEITLPEVVSHIPAQRPVVIGAHHKAFARLKGAAAGHAIERIFGVARHITGVLQTIFVSCRAAEREQLRNAPLSRGEKEVLSRFVVTAVAHLPTQFVRTVDLLSRDDIDHPAGGIAAVECRSRAAHNLDTLHVGEVQAFEIDIVHRFARQALAVDQHEHALSGKTAEVQIHITAHGLGKFQSRQLVGEHVLHVVRIGAADVLGRDHARLHRTLGNATRRARTRHHRRGQSRICKSSLRAQSLCFGRPWGTEATKQEGEKQQTKSRHFRAGTLEKTKRV